MGKRFDGIKNGFSSIKKKMIPKMFSSEFREKKKSAEKLIEDSRDSADYYMMLVLSTAIITFGLGENNAAIVIGGMLVAPVLFPILALGLGAASFRPSLFFRSFRILLSSTILILTLSSLIAYFFSPSEFVNFQVDQRLSFTLSSAFIAFLAGLAGAYAWARETLRVSLPGVAIAVALLPPLSVTGIQLAHNNMDGVQASFTLYVINIVGIFLASFIVFLFFNYRQVRVAVEKTVEEEKKKQEGE